MFDAPGMDRRLPRPFTPRSSAPPPKPLASPPVRMSAVMAGALCVVCTRFALARSTSL